MKTIEKPPKIKQMSISSPAFAAGEMIPSHYTCDGKNVNPPLDIADIPANTVSLALIVDDPDSPAGTWVHWVSWNIPVVTRLEENHVPGNEGLNDFQGHHYSGPCPPSGTHRYFFKVYALDTVLQLSVFTTKTQLEKALSGHILGYGELMGLY